LFHQGCPPVTALLSVAGRDALAHAELSATGRQYVDTALRRIDELSAEIEPLRAQLVRFARRQPGCQAHAAPLRHRLVVCGDHLGRDR
jgi:transposase